MKVGCVVETLQIKTQEAPSGVSRSKWDVNFTLWISIVTEIYAPTDATEKLPADLLFTEHIFT